MARALGPHPVATLFPKMPADVFAALMEDIRQNGVRVPIVVYRGQILDGRHRYEACRLLGRPCPQMEWNGQQPWFEAQSRNLVRRHLAQDQIYAIRKLAAERFPEVASAIETVKEQAKQRKAQAKGQPLGQKRLSGSHGPKSRSADVIGAQCGVSGATVKRVDRLAREAPALVSRVAAGELSVMKALRQAAMIKPGQSPQPTASLTAFVFDSSLRRLRHAIKGEWTKCPTEHRKAFLYGLRDVLRELIADCNTMNGAFEEARSRESGDRRLARTA